MPSAPPPTSSLTAQTSTLPATIAIPGAKRFISRRFSSVPAAHLSAYVIRSRDGHSSNISVAMRRPDERFISTLLTGHDTNIVDIEFLNPPPSANPSSLSVLGSCDEDGVVYLWFLDVEKNALAINVGLRVLRQYSFYSLRKSRTAFYSRIRLAGTPTMGTMVLVPNDGSNVRIVNFHCETKQDDPATVVPLIAPPPTPHVDMEAIEDALPESTTDPSVVTALQGPAVTTDDSNEVQIASADRSIPVYEQQHVQDPIEEEGFVDAVPPAFQTDPPVHMEYVQTGGRVVVGEATDALEEEDDYGQDGELAEDEVDEYSEEEEDYSEDDIGVEVEDSSEVDDDDYSEEEIGRGQVTGFAPSS